MGLDSAKALVAKLNSDEAMAKDFQAAKSEEEFLSAVKKYGYDVTVEDFKAALADAQQAKGKSNELSDDQLDQVAGGLSFVGIDYAFTAVQTSK